jgi:hypothetical protein
MISNIEKAAENVGITAIVTNSTEKIEVQLNKISNLEDMPLMLISWDLDVNVEFNENGFLNNPVVDVICLLMTKPEVLSKDEMETSAEEMYYLYLEFIQELRDILSPLLVNYQEQPLTGIGCKIVPKHGLGKHSGVMGRFSMITSISNC